jgi:pSer/pThr/pTyr-binding forkhead associated (FHA) protein
MMMGIDVPFDREATIGRTKGNTIVIPSEDVSKAHAKIAWDEAAAAYVVEDLGSRNGTSLDGRKIKQPERLGKNNVITLAGQIDLMFRDLGQAVVGKPLEPPQPPEPPVLDPPPAEPPRQEPPAIVPPSTNLDNEVVPLPGRLGQKREPPAPPSTNLDNEVVPLPGRLGQKRESPVPPSTNLDNEIVPLPGRFGQKPATAGTDQTKPDLRDPVPIPPLISKAQPAVDMDATRDLPILPPLMLEVYTNPPSSYPLAPGENVVGKGEKATILVRWIDVSRVHASIVVEPTRILLKDLKSSYGTIHEGRRVNGEVEIRPGDNIQFGSVKARVVPAQPPGR